MDKQEALRSQGATSEAVTLRSDSRQVCGGSRELRQAGSQGSRSSPHM